MGNSWRNIVNYPLGKRNTQPRDKGLTMVIDKGLGLRELKDLLEVAGAYLDLLKLGFGTSLLYPEKLLKAKIELCRMYNVKIYPGGTLMEIALQQNHYEAYLAQAQKLGFETIEISDGTFPLTPAERQDCLKRAVQAGFTILTELGKKNPQEVLSPEYFGKQSRKDLANGAWKVIIEARDSGKGVGIYDQQGQIQAEKFEDLLKELPDQTQIIWEAPLKSQQVDLIQRFGSEVNLGNIQPPDLLALEALRTGLRNDTLIKSKVL
jgi:phosphosulfolactate synthase